MSRAICRSFSITLLVVFMVSLSATSLGLRSIGIRVSLSWSDTPLWFGVEASTDTSWSVLAAALFITPGGKTLFTAHVDLPLQENAVAFFRITGGFYYFEPRQPLPYPLVGVGLSYMAVSASPLTMGFAGEFIYPLAFPLPMFSISGGWLP